MRRCSHTYVRKGRRDRRRCCVEKNGRNKLPANKTSDDEISHERDDCHTCARSPNLSTQKDVYVAKAQKFTTICMAHQNSHVSSSRSLLDIPTTILHSSQNFLHTSSASSWSTVVPWIVQVDTRSPLSRERPIHPIISIIPLRIASVHWGRRKSPGRRTGSIRWRSFPTVATGSITGRRKSIRVWHVIAFSFPGRVWLMHGDLLKL